MSYAAYYRDRKELAEVFERYIVSRLRHRGVAIARHTTKAGQYKFGDTTAGIEIKFDMELARTGNLYIEVDEKTDPSNKAFTRSGIFTSSSMKWYLIGNYRECYLFSRTALLEEHKTAKIIPNRTRTGHGFLLPRLRADAIAVEAFHWRNREPNG